MTFFVVVVFLSGCLDRNFPISNGYALVLDGCWALAEAELERIEKEHGVSGDVDEFATVRPFHAGAIGVIHLYSRTHNEIELRRLLSSYWSSCYPNTTLTIDRDRPNAWKVMGEQFDIHERIGMSRAFLKVTRGQLLLFMRKDED